MEDKIIEEFNKKWMADDFFVEGHPDEVRKFLLNALSKARQSTLEEENAAWVAGKRCRNCGAVMEPDPLAEMCGQCYQDA